MSNLLVRRTSHLLSDLPPGLLHVLPTTPPRTTTPTTGGPIGRVYYHHLFHTSLNSSILLRLHVLNYYRKYLHRSPEVPPRTPRVDRIDTFDPTNSDSVVYDLYLVRAWELPLFSRKSEPVEREPGKSPFTGQPPTYKSRPRVSSSCLW